MMHEFVPSISCCSSESPYAKRGSVSIAISSSSVIAVSNEVSRTGGGVASRLGVGSRPGASEDRDGVVAIDGVTDATAATGVGMCAESRGISGRADAMYGYEAAAAAKSAERVDDTGIAWL